MKNLETITKQSVSSLERYGIELADAYKVAFAGSPWFEVSRCEDTSCPTEYQGLAVNCLCPDCGSMLVEAYTTQELIDGWQAMIENDNAMMEVAFEDSVPVRATLARPTDPAELFRRKYAQINTMEQWTADNLPAEFVWIEDTFANRDLVPTGNLNNRGATLGRIAIAYGGLQVVTRTLAPAVVRSTVRDAGVYTDVYLGSEQAGQNQTSGARNVGMLPDRRTLLRVDGNEMMA